MEKTIYKDWLQFTELEDTKITKMCFQYIVRHYREKHRYYHTLLHIHDLFKQLKLLSLTQKESCILSHVIVFHDVIYDSFSKENERESAAFAVLWLEKLKIPKIFQKQVEVIILDTAAHISNNPLAELFFDMDLSVLGSPYQTYTTYCDAIRKEYKKIPDILYKKGRKQFLKSMLSRTTIFKTKIYRDVFETQARWNMHQEFKTL